MDWSKKLEEDGVIVFPLISEKEIKKISKKFEEQLAQNPLIKKENIQEYINKPAMSSFGALSDPWTFHMPVHREVNKLLHTWVKTYLKNYLYYYNFFIHCDRPMVRIPDTTIGGETWHTDNPPIDCRDRGDITLGGWVSVSGNNRFCCIPKSHKLVRPLLVKNKKTGFVPFSKEEQKKFKKDQVIFDVPPGHCILFYQNIIHCVKSGKIKTRTTRFFTGVTFTDFDTVFYDDLDDRLNSFASLQLPSGQEPVMWEKLHWTNWKDRIEEYSKNFITTIPRIDDKYIPKNLEPLTTYIDKNDFKFLTYTKEEKAILFPQKF